jgi:hypothetical protein
VGAVTAKRALATGRYALEGPVNEQVPVGQEYTDERLN